MPIRRILLDGLSISWGGGYTVGRALFIGLARARPQWLVHLALVEGHPAHAPLRDELLPSNSRLHWAPPFARGPLARAVFENSGLALLARRERIDAVVQLSGMAVPALRLPTLAHFQDPSPYLPAEVWGATPLNKVQGVLRRFAHRRALRSADLVGFTSRYLRDLICGRNGVTPRRAEIFPNGLDESALERAKRPLLNWVNRPFEIVTVGNVLPHKRQWLVIDALARLAARPGFEALRYRIVGRCEPRYRSILLERARRLGVEDRVVFEGHVSDERVHEALAGARCFVLMSVMESFGIPALEAMTFGTPVVTTDCCAMPEVCDGAAELCPPDDPATLADTIARVMTDAAHAEDLRRRGAERAQRFGWAVTAERMAASIEEILD